MVVTEPSYEMLLGDSRVAALIFKGCSDVRGI